VIEVLLAYGADPDSKNDSGVSPRELAKRIGNYDVLQFFST
jgi:ankyrin repeat protein